MNQTDYGLCQCGCGQPTKIAAQTSRHWGHVKGQPHRFRRGHAHRGKTLTPEVKAKMSAAHTGKTHTPEAKARMQGENNHGWKGDAAGYQALHMWVRKHKNRTGVCADCGASGRTELANVDHQYRRDISDYIELCARCHWAYDDAHDLRGKGAV